LPFSDFGDALNQPRKLGRLGSALPFSDFGDALNQPRKLGRAQGANFNIQRKAVNVTS